MRLPDISVVLPIRDDPQVLALTLRSLAAQDLDSALWEVVLVDDGSVEPVAEMPETALLKNLRVIRHDTSLGRSAARNTGIRVSRGEVVLLLDGDSYAAPDLVKRHWQFHFSSPGPNRVLLGGRYEPSWETFDALVRGSVEVPSDGAEQDLRQSMFGLEPATFATVGAPWLFVFTHNMSVRRADLQDVNLFDETFDGWGHEDIDLGFRLFMNAGRSRDYFVLDTSAYCFHLPHYRNSAVQSAESRANLERFWRKHPYYDAELYGKSRRLVAETVERYDRVLDAYRSSALGAVDHDWLGTTVGDSKAIVLVASGSGLNRRGRTVTFDHRMELGPSNLHLLGHRTPFDDAEFDAVVHVDLWQHLAVNEIGGIVAEGMRIARRLYFIETDAPREGILGNRCSIDYFMSMISGRFAVRYDRMAGGHLVTVEPR